MTDTPSDRPQYPTQPGPQPGQYPPGQYPPGGPPAARRRNGMGTTALVLGVVAIVLVLLLLFSPVGAFLGLLAVLFGILGIMRANRGEADNRGQAVAGLVTGAIALLVGAFFTISIGVWTPASSAAASGPESSSSRTERWIRPGRGRRAPRPGPPSRGGSRAGPAGTPSGRCRRTTGCRRS